MRNSLFSQRFPLEAGDFLNINLFVYSINIPKLQKTGAIYGKNVLSLDKKVCLLSLFKNILY